MNTPRPLASLLRTLSLSLVACCVVLGARPEAAHAARIKDIAHVQGARANQLIGYGIVVGLDNTGDTGQAALTTQTIASMLGRLNIKIDRKDLRTRNVAAVMVTAELPGFSKSGQSVDVAVSSLGDARSLKGGTLLLTPLRGVDGEVYAMAQGALSVGGFEVRGVGANSTQRNHLNVGRIPDGAMIERGVEQEWETSTSILLNLFDADFTTAVEMANVINQTFADPSVPVDDTKPIEGVAQALDAATIRVDVPADWQEHAPQFIAKIEKLQVTPDTIARVVVNERTGTVVLGGDVRIREVAVAHGNLTLNISTDYAASQPGAFFGQGQTAVLPDSGVEADEQQGKLNLIEEGATIGEVVSALNAIGVSPRDLIAILQAIKAAGALDAQLEIQ